MVEERGIAGEQKMLSLIRRSSQAISWPLYYVVVTVASVDGVG